MKKSPYEIETFKSVADFPRVITKPYAKEALEIIERKISRLKVEKINYKNNKDFVNTIDKEIKKFEGFKTFIGKKLKEILDAEFEKLTGSKKSKETKVETKVETVETVEIVEKPKDTEDTEETKETKESKESKKIKKTRRKKSEDK